MKKLLVTLLMILTVSVTAAQLALPWVRVPGVSVVDTGKTVTLQTADCIVFKNYGETHVTNEENFFQVTWACDYVDYPEVPDFLVISSSLQKVVGNGIMVLGMRIALQDSGAYRWDGVWQKPDTTWKDLRFSMSYYKEKGMKFFGRLYIIFLLSTEKPQNVGLEVGVKTIYGEDSSHVLLKNYNDYQGPLWVKDESVEKFSLSQNFPNPFNPSTTIRFSISNPAFVSLIVYDVQGMEVASLVGEEKPAGEYEVSFNASALASGVYVYRLTAGNLIMSRKMSLVK